MNANAYSARWFDFFHTPIPEDRTRLEVEFVTTNAPLPGFRRVADICCGMGRHARALTALGYEITGVERNATAVEVARQMGGGPRYVCADVRESVLSPNEYDAIIVMSQSFGYFDEATNIGVLTGFGDALRPGGRVVLDLWNPDFFHRHQGERSLDLPLGTIIETKEIRENRLLVRLEYPDGGVECFDWQLFTSQKMAELAKAARLQLLVSCTNFDNTTVPYADSARIQFVLAKP